MITRKSHFLVHEVRRRFIKGNFTPDDYSRTPPVIANAFPKSGTHLLLQVLEAFPGIKNHGLFIASKPSLSYRLRTDKAHLHLIDKVLPSEVVPAHLHYAPEYLQALEKKNAAPFFIYRDLRDVVVSEMHYLTSMNRWHRLHRIFRELPNDEERLSLAIRGLDGAAGGIAYPDIGERFGWYAGWLDCPGVMALKFEDLRGVGSQVAAIRAMIEHYQKQCRVEFDQDQVLEKAIANIEPERSHTFREGGMGGWREQFTDEHKDLMKTAAGELLVRLGYETDEEW